jgi:predicted NBD/HSP70 family sugar kinase
MTQGERTTAGVIARGSAVGPLAGPATGSRGGPVVGPAPGTASRVYEHIVRNGPLPRTDIARQLGLSAATLTRLTRELLDAGLLRELEPWPQGKGRPQLPLDVDDEYARFIGVKITRDAIYAAVTTVRGAVLEETSAALASHGPDDVVAAAEAVCRPLIDAHPRVAGIGVGLAGQVEDHARVLGSHMLGWEQPVDLADVVRDRLGLPVSVVNDFHGLLHGLNWFGVGRRHGSFLLITIGAGVAVGVVQDGVVHEGRTHTAGLTGRITTATRDGRAIPLDRAAGTDGVLAVARARGVLGEDGTLEDLLALARGRAAGGSQESAEEARTGGSRDGEQRAEAAREVAADVAHAVAGAAAGFLGVLDPEALLLGGEAVELLDPRTGFDTALRGMLRPAQRDLQIRRLPADFDDWARGAAVIAVQRFIGGR